jgi:hypothetical protein
MVSSEHRFNAILLNRFSDPKLAYSILLQAPVRELGKSAPADLWRDGILQKMKG